ncbi:hypothetical protein GLV98_09920 [Halobacillus litoralis]|uniref:DUF91 domain-containing protein n=1 Tax=Halobacillus litoralis TaxID=45668 RepID=A0A845E6L4_9BACI|nr:hypothetical protein [Halobacillus litoralis]MYL49806.1 hypothetical protein [Halobacillus litoralis]
MLMTFNIEETSGSKKKITKSPEEISKVTYKKLGLTEEALEDFLQDHIEVITLEEEWDLKIIGKQVRNDANKRTDLVGLDSNGSIVIIEIKRDEQDMKARRDNFESQAIRYAASFAKIETIEDLVEQVYGRFLLQNGEVDESRIVETGVKEITDFLQKNEALDHFNQNQRIILIASSFEPSVLSASTWLLSQGVDISCIEVAPHLIDGKDDKEYILKVNKLLPLGSDDDYLSEIVKKEFTTSAGKVSNRKPGEKHRVLPRLNQMLEDGLVDIGDEIYHVSDEEGSKTKSSIHGPKEVLWNGKVYSLNEWGAMFHHKEKVNAYTRAVVVRYGKTLEQMRKDYYKL